MCAGRVPVHLQLILIILFVFISQGSCLQCYKCYGTRKHCYTGTTEFLSIANCSNNEVCATYQYQVDDSGVSYVTTIRGCQPIVKEGICTQIMTKKEIKNVVQTGILCNICNTDLCNDSSIIHLSYLVLFVAIIVTFFKM